MRISGVVLGFGKKLLFFSKRWGLGFDISSVTG